MRILYIDIDTLRPDHLGCYGYHRNTSPNIDALASQALVFDNVYASDVPCLPSRTALLTGRFGIHNGVVNHGGTDAEPVIYSTERRFRTRLHNDSFPTRLQRAGLKTASVSSFAQRHSAFFWYAGFDEAYNVGKGGLETADEVHEIASDWLARNGDQDDWFLHVHMWDPHTPYRADQSYGEPYVHDALPQWLTEEIRAQHWRGCGPHSAQECNGFEPHDEFAHLFPRQPSQIPDMQAVRRMFDGYDTGVLVADEFVGRLFDQLTSLGVMDDTVIMISSDHGETLGELNVYGDHQTADDLTTHIPMILRWPGITDNLAGTRLKGLHYQVDLSATILDLLGQKVPSQWDGQSFATDLKAGKDGGRDHLVVYQGAWTCQRAVRWQDWICIQTLHDGYHLYDDVMLFDLSTDPHETNNLANTKEEVLGQGLRLLGNWHGTMMAEAARGRDPLQHVISEGGPFHVRGELPKYLKRLRATDRGTDADALEEKYGESISV